jgi:hypothetical protein
MINRFWSMFQHKACCFRKILLTTLHSSHELLERKRPMYHEVISRKFV